MKKQFLKYRFYFVSLVLILCAALLLLLARSCRENRSMEVLPVKAIEKLPEFQVQDVTEIELIYGNHTAKLIRGSDVWELHTKGKPVVIADPEKVLLLLDDISRAKLLRELSIDTETAAAALLLSGEAAENGRNHGCRVILRGKTGKEIRNLLLGRVHYSVGEQIGRYRTNIPDGRYVRLQLDGKSHYFLMSRPMLDTIPLSAFWANPVSCPNMGMPILIRYTDLANKKILWEVRLTENRYDLTIPKSKKLNIKDMQQKLGFLTQAPLSRDVAAADVEFKPDSRLDIIYANGFSYSLEMQNDPFDEWKRFGRLTPAYDPEFSFRAQGETDEAFAKRKKQYQTELEREKKLFGGQIFVLRPNLINIFETVPEK